MDDRSSGGSPATAGLHSAGKEPRISHLKRDPIGDVTFERFLTMTARQRKRFLSVHRLRSLEMRGDPEATRQWRGRHLARCIREWSRFVDARRRKQK